MTNLFYKDESQHDNRQMPYEVRGGFAFPASKPWVRRVQCALGDERQYEGMEINTA